MMTPEREMETGAIHLETGKAGLQYPGGPGRVRQRYAERGGIEDLGPLHHPESGFPEHQERSGSSRAERPRRPLGVHRRSNDPGGQMKQSPQARTHQGHSSAHLRQAIEKGAEATSRGAGIDHQVIARTLDPPEPLRPIGRQNFQAGSGRSAPIDPLSSLIQPDDLAGGKERQEISRIAAAGAKR